MPKWFKALFIGICLICFLALAFFTAGLAWIKTRQGQKFVQNTVNHSIPGQISWEELNFELWRGRLDFRNIVIRDPAGKDLGRVNRLFLYLKWRQLFQGRLIVEDLTLEGPALTLRRNKIGRLNVVEAFTIPGVKRDKPAKKRGLPLDFEINRIMIAGARVGYDTPEGPMFFQADELVVSGYGDASAARGEIRLELSQGLATGPAMDARLDRAVLSGTYHDRKIDGIDLKVKTPSSTLSLTGNIRDIFTSPSLDMVLSLNASLEEIKTFTRIEGNYSGNAALDLTVSGALSDPMAGMTLICGCGDINNTPVKGIQVEMELKNRVLFARKFHADAFSGSLDLEGKVDFSKAFPKGFTAFEKNLNEISYDLVAMEQGMDAGTLFMVPENLKGPMETAVKIKGHGIFWKTLSADLDVEIAAKKLVTGENLELSNLRIDAKGRLAGGLIRIERLDAGANDAKLGLTGFYDPAGRKVKADLFLEIPDAAPLFSAMGMEKSRGRIMIQAKAEGPVTRPEAAAAITSRGFALKGVSIGDVTAGLRLAGNRVHIDEFTLRNHDSILNIEGEVRLLETGSFHPMPDPSFRLKIQSDALFIQDFVKDATGKITLSMDAGGSFKHPVAGLEIEGSGIKFRGQEIHGFKVASGIAGKKFSVNDFVMFPSKGETIEGRGYITLGKEFQFVLTSSGISFDTLQAAKDRGIKDGRIIFNVMGQGAVDDPDIKGEIILSGITVNKKTLDDVSILLGVKEGILRVSGNPGFDFKGSYRLENGEFSVLSAFHDTDLSPWFDLANRPFFTGTLTGTMNLSGTAGEETSYRGLLDVSKTDIFFKKKDLVQGKNLRVNLSGKEIFIPGLHLDFTEDGHVDVSGKINLSGPVFLKTDAALPLSVAGVFASDFQDLSGMLALSARMAGKLSSPEIQGVIKLSDAGGTVPYLEQHLHDVNGSIHVTPGSIDIENLEGYLDSGRFNASGSLQLEGVQPVSISADVSARALPVKIPDTMDMVLDGNLMINGTPDKSTIRGEVVLVEGLYYKQVNLNFLSGAMKKKRNAPISRQDINIPFIRNTALDVAVKHRAPFSVDNNLARLEIIPDLKVAGSVNHPVINGRARITSGNVYYRKKTFVVQKGVVDFLNPYKIEPTIDLLSEVAIRDWVISLAVSGTPDELAFKLTSVPSLDDADILALLLTGRTSREMTGGGGGSNLSARQMLAQALADAVDEDVKKAMKLDILEAEINGSGTEESGGVKVTMGKELSKRMAVKYIMETEKGEMVQRAVAEYKFLEDILFSGYQNNQGAFGGSVKYRLEFR